MQLFISHRTVIHPVNVNVESLSKQKRLLWINDKYTNDAIIYTLITIINYIQWNPSCKATPFASEKWPFKRGGLSSGVKINTLMLTFALSSGLSRGGGLSSGWPPKRGSTAIVNTYMMIKYWYTALIQSMGDRKSTRWRYLVCQFYYPRIRAVSFSLTDLKLIRHRQ